MKELASAVTNLQDHFPQSIIWEILYLDIFARFVHNRLLLYLGGTNLPTVTEGEWQWTCLAAPVAETCTSIDFIN